jgi:flagellin
VSLAKSYANVVASASFNGVNVIDAGSQGLSAIGSADGSIKVTSAHSKINVMDNGILGTVLTGSAGTVAAGSTTAGVDSVTGITTAWADGTGAAAAAVLTKMDAAIKTVTSTLSGFGVSSKAVDNQLTLVGKLQDNLNAGVGNLVDANLAQESANLQSLQTKQQLGVQALSIANQSSGILLGLFR